MPVAGKSIFGAKGVDLKNSPFRIDPLRSQAGENFVVTSGTRRTRPGLSRWKYDKYCSNAARFIGTYKKSWITFKDTTNTNYNIWDGSALINGTIEARVKLHGAGGFSLAGNIPICSRQLHGSGYTFQLALVTNDGAGNGLEKYHPNLVISNASTTFTFDFNDFANTTIKHGVWTTISIVKDQPNLRMILYLNGQQKQIIAFTAPNTPFAVTGTFATTRNDPTYSDVVVGAQNDLNGYGHIDIDFIRLWRRDRTANEIIANYQSDLDPNDNNQLMGNFNFQGLHDGNIVREQAGSPAIYGYAGGRPPFMDDATKQLNFDGSSMYGQMTPAGNTANAQVNNYWGAAGISSQFIQTSEIAFSIMKFKQCRIIGGLSLFSDGVNGYGFLYKFKNAGADSSISSGILFNSGASDVGVEHYVAIRVIFTGSPSTTPTSIEMWVDGVKKATQAMSGACGGAAGEVGTNIGCGPAFNADFSCIKVRWIRTFMADWGDDYYQTQYNQEVEEFKVNMHSTGVQNMTWQGANQRLVTGVGTVWNPPLISNTLNFYFTLYENKNAVPGEDYQDRALNYNTAAQTFQGFVADDTGDPWTVATWKITNLEGYMLTALITRYNVVSWQTIKQDKTTFRQVALINSILQGGQDRDNDPKFHIDLLYFITGGAGVQIADQRPSFVGGTTRISNPFLPPRFIGQFKTPDGAVDAIITIVGTSFNAFDRVTKTLTQYPISILPNNHKAFVGDFLDGGLYLTDGVTKIHVYAYKKQLRVVRWGFTLPLSLPTLAGYQTTGSFTGTYQFAYCYYNREIDQFGPFPTAIDALANYPQVAPSTNRAIQVGNLVGSPTFFEGVTDIAVFRTLNIAGAGGGIVGQLWLVDFTRGNSQGYMDWSVTDTKLRNRYPLELVGVTDIDPPDGDFVCAHNGRLWVAEDDKIRFSRVGAELHADLKSETYIFPADHFFPIPGGKRVTAAASYTDNTIAIWTIDTMDIVSGSDQTDFERRRVYEGVGCASHRTVKKAGNALIWLGLDDLYVFVDGKPQPLDTEGKISYYIQNNIDKANIGKSFAVLNLATQVYELHLLDTNSFWRTIFFDLKTGEYTFAIDHNAVCGTVVSHDNNRPTAFYAIKEGGAIVNQNSGIGGAPFTNYPPTSGATRATISTAGGVGLNYQLNFAGFPFSVAEMGSAGNFCYIVNPNGGVLRAKILSSTLNSLLIDFSTTGSREYFFSNTQFNPAAGMECFIGPIFFHLRTSIIYTATSQNMIAAIGGETADPLVWELIGISPIAMPIAQANTIAWLGLRREGGALLESQLQIANFNAMSTMQKTIESSRGQFIDFEFYYLHDTAPLDLLGFILYMNITEGDFVS